VPAPARRSAGFAISSAGSGVGNSNVEAWVWAAIARSVLADTRMPPEVVTSTNVTDLKTYLEARRRNPLAPGVVHVETGVAAATSSAAMVLSMPLSANKMTPEEFRSTLAAIFGAHGWQSIFARGTGLHFSTVQRYLNAELPIPQHVVVLVQALAALHADGQPLPAAFRRQGNGRRRRNGG